MRTRKYKLLRPDEIAAEKKRKSIAYQPVGLLEWHGPALPMGVDGILAERASLASAEITGGVVLPTLYCGFRRPKSREELVREGFDDPDIFVEGMDYPRNTVNSFYSREEVFMAMIRDLLRMLVQHEYSLVVFVTGHEEGGCHDIMERLCEETNRTTATQVILCDVWVEGEPGERKGHGTRRETSVVMNLTDGVNLGALPPMTEKLRYQDWGIVDGKPSPDGLVQDDPRLADPAEGLPLVHEGINRIAQTVNAAYREKLLSYSQRYT